MSGGKYTGSVPSKSNFCHVQTCRAKYLQKLNNVKLSFFKIPKPESETHQIWKGKLGISKPVNWYRLCELHFAPQDFLRDLEAELTGRPLRKRLKEGSVPSLFLTPEENFVPDLKSETLEDIQNSDILTQLAKSLRQFKGFQEPKKPVVQKRIFVAAAQSTVKIAPKITENSTALNLLFSTPSEMICDDLNSLKIKVMQQEQKIQELTTKLNLQSQFDKNLKRKLNQKETVIKKLRIDLSGLRKERRKLRQREYMRKLKQRKMAEKKKERRAWICKQIEAGKVSVFN